MYSKKSIKVLEEVLDFVPEPIFAINLKGEVILWNKAIEELFGVDRKDMLGKGNFEYAIVFYNERRSTLVDLALKPDESKEALYNNFKRYCNGDVEGESYIKEKDYYDWGRASKLFDEHNDCIGAISISRDMSSYRKIEAEMDDDKRRFEILFENSPDAIAYLDSKHRILDINIKFASLFGYKLDDCIGKDLDEVVSKPEDCTEAKDITKSLYYKGVVKKQVVRYKKDGSPMDLQARGILVKTGDRVLGAYGVYTDIGELVKKERDLKESNVELEAALNQLKAAESELRYQYEKLEESKELLRKSEEKNKAIINTLPDMIFIFDAKGTIVDIQGDNIKSMNIRKSHIGQNCLEVFERNSANLILDKIKNAIKTKRMQVFEYVKPYNKDNKYFEFRLSQMDSNEILAVVRDITKEKKYKEKIEYMLFHDQLTGLYDRVSYGRCIKDLDKKANLPLTIIISDLNGLKLVNDAFGLKTGDKLLKNIANILKKNCPENSRIIRVGGDEFSIMLPKTTESKANNLIEQIKSDLSKVKVESLILSMSFGTCTKFTSDQNIYEIHSNAEDKMNRMKLYESPSMRGKTISTIIKTLHEKNSREEQHSHRVSELCVKMGMVMGFSSDDIQELKTVGLLHDIGKIGIEESILNKPGKLTDEEMDQMKKHPEIGYRILSSVNDMAEMANYVLSHHERIDGKGYPRGLKGMEIPLQSRIIGIADTYDAMTSHRSYRQAMTDQEAIDELIRVAGTQHDAYLVEIFVNKVIRK